MCLGGSLSLRIDADNRLSIAPAQVHPLFATLEIHFHTVDGVDLLRSEMLLYGVEYAVNQGTVAQIDAVL